MPLDGLDLAHKLWSIVVSRVVNVHEAKTHLLRLLDEAHAGKEIILAKAGKPYARLMPLAAALATRQPERLPGRLGAGLQPLVPDPHHAPRAGACPLEDRDPFDRRLAASFSANSRVINRGHAGNPRRPQLGPRDRLHPTRITCPACSRRMRCGVSSRAISAITPSSSPGLMWVM